MTAHGTQPAAERDPIHAEGRSLLAELLHALNQPLTGLQCSLELASSGPRPAEQYIRTVREGLELTGRIRILVEAIRHITDPEFSAASEPLPFPFASALREAVADLLPVAESQNMRVRLECPGVTQVVSDHRRVGALLFSTLEPVLSLARTGSGIHVSLITENAAAVLSIVWTRGPKPTDSPYSKPEIALLVAGAEWEQIGARWARRSGEATETCTVRLPAAAEDR